MQKAEKPTCEESIGKARAQDLWEW